MVTTLPITPRLSAQFQTLLSAFVVWLYASFSKDFGVLALNLTGERMKDFDSEGKLNLRNRYWEYCRQVGFADLRIWSDDDPQYAKYVSKHLEQLREQKLLYDKSTSVLVCPCGAVEVLVGASLLSVGAKTYTLSDSGKLTCKLCGGLAREESVHSLLFHFPKLSLQDISIYPSWIRKEVDEMANKFSDSELLVSRSKRTAAPFFESRSGLALDSDFFWSMFSDYLARSMADGPIVLVTSHRTVRQVFQVAVMSRIVGCRQPISIIITPTFQFRGKNGNTVFLSAEQFCRAADPEALRYLLSLSLNWRFKETVVETTRLYWIGHSIHPDEVGVSETSQTLGQGIEEFLRVCNQVTADRLILKLRKKRLLDMRENRLRKLLGGN